MEPTIDVVPPGFHSVNSYLILEGAGKFLEFLKAAFEAEEKLRVPLPDGTLMHSEVKVGDTMLEAADANKEWKAMPADLHYYVVDVDRVYLQGIKAGAVSLYEPKDMEYGDREAGLRDPAGNNWFIATHKAGRSYRPELLRDVNPGFSVKDAAAFLGFLEKAFDAEIIERHENSGIVGHAKIRIGDTVMETSEAHGQWGPRAIAVHYYVRNCDEVYSRALAAGGKSIGDVQDKPYGERNGGVQDAWGNHWYIATRLELLGKGKVDAGPKAQAQSKT